MVKTRCRMRNRSRSKTESCDSTGPALGETARAAAGGWQGKSPSTTAAGTERGAKAVPPFWRVSGESSIKPHWGQRRVRGIDCPWVSTRIAPQTGKCKGRRSMALRVELTNQGVGVLLRRRLAAEVGGPHPPPFQHREYRLEDAVRGLVLSQMAQHQDSRKKESGRIGDALAGDVGSG